MRRVDPPSSLAFYEKLVASAPLMLWILDLETKSLVHLNARARAFLGDSIDPPGALPPIDRIVDAPDAKILESAIRRLMARRDAEIEEVEFRVRRGDGSVRWVSTRIAAFEFDRKGALGRIIGGSTDITESRRIEERIDGLGQEENCAWARERREIASLLHDSVGQLLPLANAKLGLLRECADERLRAQILEIQQLLVEAHATGRSLSSRLSPPTIHEIGLATAWRVLVREIERQHGLKTSVETHTESIPLSEVIERTLYRVVRELLVNAAKHSAVSEASLRTRVCGTELMIEVKDRGVGFDPAATRSSGLGLRSAQDQLDELGARMKVDSRPGDGTRIELRIPLRNPTDERRASNESRSVNPDSLLSGGES
jgi:PAS domain S-box-containing protein